MNDLKNTIAALTPGKKYSIEIVRDGKKTTLFVVPSVRNESAETSDGVSKEESGIDNQTFGMTLKETGKGGIIVEKVEVNKIADKSGIQSGDIILAIKISPDKPFVDINSVKDFNKEIKGLKNDLFVLRLSRNGQKFFVSVKIQK
jgi:C-terminal processing protease CtpA/Prc